MPQSAPHTMAIDATLNSSIARAQLVRFQMDAPIDTIMQRDNVYWMDFCLSPRPENARGCYREHWSPERFKRLGNMFLLPPSETLHTRSDGCSHQDSLVCELDREGVIEWFEGDLTWTDQRLEASLDINTNSIRILMLRLVEELRHPGFASETLVELIFAQLAIELRRYCTSVREREHTGGLSTWRLRAIDERLHEIREAPSLAELADLCGLSVRQMTRGFKASRNCSIGDYVANNRIEQARQLLAGEQSIKAIAYTLGFSSPSSFCYAFRRTSGETPGQFRQRSQRRTSR